MFVHAALASATNIPEIAINDDEGKHLARAIADVQQHYGAVLDPKTQAWVNLAIVAGSMYLPRVMIARARMQLAHAPQQERAAPQTVEEQVFGGYNYDIPAPTTGPQTSL